MKWRLIMDNNNSHAIIRVEKRGGNWGLFTLYVCYGARLLLLWEGKDGDESSFLFSFCHSI